MKLNEMRHILKFSGSIIAIALVAGLGLAGCGSSDTASTSSSPRTQTETSEATQSSAFCDGLVDLNTQADSLVQSVSSNSTVRAAVTVTKDLGVLSARVEVVAEREVGVNGANLKIAGNKFERGLDAIDLKVTKDSRTASVTAAADTFQSSLNTLAGSAQCGSETTE